MVVGSIELLPVPDAVGLLAEYGDVYPEVPAEAWEPYRELYPELFSAESWRLPCNCFIVRSGGITILVDTGVGPPGLWDWTAEDEGRLPGALDDLGIRPDDVDIVFLTHLHIDHLGWNTDLEGVAFFPRARYVVHEDALAFARTRPNLPHIRRCVESLVDRFETVAGDVELSPGVAAFVAPGHYPGHMALRLAADGEQAVLLADTAVHPALLNQPDWVYAADGDPDACADTRRALLPELVDRDVLVACGHYPRSGIGRVVTRDGQVVWEEAR
ncbi:MAG: fold metallo-hydrolase [Thermoleophilia bacterium]|nr:fold metallo-hydrolase [Thermoleophilia bacterium]